MTRIEELMNGGLSQQVWNASYNTMLHEAEQCPYSVVLYGPWGFEPTIGAHEIREARGTATAFVKQHPDTESYEIWRGNRRIEHCDVLPPSDDTRALQAIGWPGA